jgi:hypothetical protein
MEAGPRPGRPHKLTGLLMLGHDCDCSAMLACQHCGRPLAAARSQACYCSDRCRVAACRDRNRNK